MGICSSSTASTAFDGVVTAASLAMGTRGAPPQQQQQTPAKHHRRNQFRTSAEAGAPLPQQQQDPLPPKQQRQEPQQVGAPAALLRQRHGKTDLELPARPARPPQIFLLNIGINYRGQACQLNGCVNDVRNLRRIFMGPLGIAQSCTRALTDDCAPTSADYPSRANILRAIDDMVQRLQPGDFFIFHYSGHGGSVEDRHGIEADGRAETILPADHDRAGAILDRDLTQHFTCPVGAAILCVFDCCHSGTVLNLGYGMSATGVCDTDPLALQDYTARRRSSGQVFCVSACRDCETDADAWIQGQGKGALSHGLEVVLRDRLCGGGGGASLTWLQMLRELRTAMHDVNPAQQPQVSSLLPLQPSQPFPLITGTSFLRSSSSASSSSSSTAAGRLHLHDFYCCGDLACAPPTEAASVEAPAGAPKNSARGSAFHQPAPQASRAAVNPAVSEYVAQVVNFTRTRVPASADGAVTTAMEALLGKTEFSDRDLTWEERKESAMLACASFLAAVPASDLDERAKQEIVSACRCTLPAVFAFLKPK